MDSNFNQYIALTLNQIKKKLNKKYSFKFIENKPPRQNKGKGQKRVISINEIDSNMLKIIWSYEDYIDTFD